MDSDKKPWRIAHEKGYLSSFQTWEREEPTSFHGAFLPQTAESLILRHTEPDDWIWDPMAGSGTTGDVAARLGRNCLMTDLSPVRDDIYQANALVVKVTGTNCPEHIWEVDRWDHPMRPPQLRHTLSELEAVPYEFRFDLIILHPPYFNAVVFSDDRRDLSNLQSSPTETSLKRFYGLLGMVAQNLVKHLKPRGYIGLVVGDYWVAGKHSHLESLAFKSMEVVVKAMGAGVRLKAIQVKNIEGHARHRGKDTNLWLSRFYKWGALSLDHEYIFSIQKD